MFSDSASLAVNMPSLGHLSRRQRRLVDRLARLRCGSLQLRVGAHTLSLRGAADGPQADMTVRRPTAMLRRLFWRGDLGLAESYMAGDWTTRDLARLLELFAVNMDALEDGTQPVGAMRVLSRIQHWLRRNSRRGSRRNIAAHYDLGNEFYAQWLDHGMGYSAGLFDRSSTAADAAPDVALERAQERKFARMLDLLDAKPGQTILEIGCGWGGFAEYAARHGMRVIGLTLSTEQLAFARARIARAGLDEHVDLRLCDYRDFDQQVDHVVSIEMFEAVGRDYWQVYFDRLRACVRPGGRVALQVITIDEGYFAEYAANPGGFIQRYIFPGGMLPTRTHLRELAASVGMAPRAEDAFAEDYADTLAHWHRRFRARTNWLESRGYDRRFRRMWRYYLGFCEAGFRSGHIDVVQLGLDVR